MPGTNYVVAAGKSGNIYVVDRTLPLNGSGPGFTATDDGNYLLQVFAGFAVWNKSIFSWGGNTGNDYVQAFSLTGGDLGRGNVLSISGEQGGVLSVSSCYDQNALLWTVLHHDDVHKYEQGELIVYNPSILTTQGVSPVLRIPFLDTTNTPANAMKFTAPLVINGRVYVVTMSQEILVYGIPSQSGQTAPACVGQPPA